MGSFIGHLGAVLDLILKLNFFYLIRKSVGLGKKPRDCRSMTVPSRREEKEAGVSRLSVSSDREVTGAVV